MSYFKFKDSDIIHTSIVANPSWNVVCNNNQISGSIYLEKNFLNGALQARQIRGFSERLGGLVTKSSIMTASVTFGYASRTGTNNNAYANISNTCGFYSLGNPIAYNLLYSGSLAPQLRYVNIPSVYYDRQILTGSLVMTDKDGSGTVRTLRDDGRGTILEVGTSASIGTVFYSEGLVVLKAPSYQNFAAVSPDAFKWQIQFKGVHTIPVSLFRCRAPAGTLNASTNPTFSYIPQSGSNKNTRQVLSSSLSPYITAVGLYDSEYRLVAVARLAQPVKKEFGWDVSVNLKLDF